MEKSSENKIYRAIGLMSGTAMDGIDAAMIETDGYNYTKPIGFVSVDHNPAMREELKSQLNSEIFDKSVERDFTMAQIPAINELLVETKLNPSDIDVIGFHGQTTHHDPDNGVTVQMGDGQLLASEMGIDVVYDFRKNDMKYGGQGAPLLPVYHRALLQNSELSLPVVILNLGGVGNITYIDNDDMIAFDTGPANALIDDWIQKNTNKKYDDNGKIASKGRVDQDIIDEFLSLSYFLKKYPKSLDRNDFSGLSVGGLSLEDGATTLTEMTVQSVAKGVDLCPRRPNEIYVTGGGRHNDFMMSRLSCVVDCPIKFVDGLGKNGDAMEAEGFAYMAVRSLLGELISYTNTTGCAFPVSGGVHVTSKKKAA